MRFTDTLSVNEAEVLAGRYSSLSGKHYIIYYPAEVSEKYIIRLKKFRINSTKNIQIHKSKFIFLGSVIAMYLIFFNLNYLICYQSIYLF